MAITETVPFNFNELYTNLEQKFIASGYDTAQGSNVSQLITAMAYFTSMLNVNTAVNINETILPLSTQRDNVLADARALGYEIQHKQSYSYMLTLSLSGAASKTYSIPKYSVFTQGNKSYYYLGSTIDVQTQNQTDVTNVEVLVTEGNLIQFSDYPNSLIVDTIEVQNESGQTVPQYYIDIPFTDVEDSGIECFVDYLDNFGNNIVNEEWTKSTQFLIDSSIATSKKFFRLDDIANRTPRIYFEIAGIGDGLQVGTTVKFNVLQTSGVNGEMTTPLDPNTVSHSLADVTVTGISLITKGTDEESITSIKANAPKFYNSANRAVTATDYKSICNRQTSVKDSFIWGGDEELPKSPGHIWFSFLPSTINRTFTADSINSQFLLDNNKYIGWDYRYTKSNNLFSNQNEITFNSTNKTISVPVNGSFDFTGVNVGDTITISGSTNNDRTFTVASTTSNVLTVSSGDVIVDANPEIKAITFVIKGTYETQLAAALDYYSQWYVQDSEIFSTSVNDSGQLIRPGIWNVLESYKIPTLQFHNRHPIYMDFEYDIEILKYDIVTSKADINRSVFDVVDNFFTGYTDTLAAETFEFSYFHSSLEKRIDSFLTDASGYNNVVTTNLLLTQKNVVSEYLNKNYNDIFIPLSTPFESYFDSNGFLLYDVLPSIDTDAFIDFRSLQEVQQNLNVPTTRIYTDWSTIASEIAGSQIQSDQNIITAPIRVSMKERIDVGVVGNTPTVLNLVDVEIYPDDPAQLDLGNTANYTKTVITKHKANGTTVQLTKDIVGANGWSLNNSTNITLNTPLGANEYVLIETESMCGNYILFNSFKKYIMVQLFIDARNNVSATSSSQTYSDPKSYLTTTDNLYDYTVDSRYVTTDGYSLTSTTQVNSLTGSIVSSITPSTYYGSPLKYELFKRDRTLNLKYKSPNFKMSKNIIPRLNRVSFI